MRFEAIQRYAALGARWASAGLGVWLMASPAIFNYAGAADTSDRVVGPLIVTFSICAAWAVIGGLRWLNTLAAAWLLIAPWILGFPPPAAINSVVVGVLVLGLSLIPLRTDQKFGGGWRALFGRAPA